MAEYNKNKAVLAQKKYIEENKAPDFAPNNGVCFKCHRNIYEPFTRTKTNILGEEKEVTTGITVEEARTTLVTGCPHCNRSYCS